MMPVFYRASQTDPKKYEVVWHGKVHFIGEQKKARKVAEELHKFEEAKKR
jgi:hypothetical protein